MRKIILVVSLSLLSASTAFAQRHRIVGLPDASYALLTGRVTDAAEGGGVVMAEVSAPQRFARTFGDGLFTMELPVGIPTVITISRTGYQTLTQTVTLAGPENRTFLLQPLPLARITTTTGTTYIVDADSLEFGYVIPFLGARRDRLAKMCRPGQEPFTLDRSEIDRITGPMRTVTDEACCATGPLTGADFQLATGETITAYFADSCEHTHIQLYARDHKTYDSVWVEIKDLQEAVIP